MKRILFLAIAFMAMTIVHAQQNDSTVVFNKTVHDFGDIAQGVPQTYSFEFKNTGKEVLTIDNVRPSCGCTSSGWTKEPVKPGGKGYVSATYNAARTGVFNKSLTVTSNGTPNIITLRIKGNVVAPVAPQESLPDNNK
ncbi:MAG: DUF1573 domain-containing protein [Candidatus Azobacteroides sp.]|nr:DUF1573 domain-containing protein [Candidatus Azobacteroides sp.]